MVPLDQFKARKFLPVAIAFRASCHFCMESIGFYKGILRGGRVAFLTPKGEVVSTREALIRGGVVNPEIIEVDFQRNRLAVTPLVLAVDPCPLRVEGAALANGGGKGRHACRKPLKAQRSPMPKGAMGKLPFDNKKRRSGTESFSKSACRPSFVGPVRPQLGAGRDSGHACSSGHPLRVLLRTQLGRLRRVHGQLQWRWVPRGLPSADVRVS